MALYGKECEITFHFDKWLKRLKLWITYRTRRTDEL